ncbi:helix-turn-helix transcriptional regulator [Plantactinospora sp. KBS50]|uniref:helix-turn-helix domain-containing protein n=1 Tax=Plantactinospora sp. KBS50 TaxID=2024580 RepID=UPI000BAAF2EC|nr:helix-turn-helix transcriptional regulator [Plantactinospora sp. KBS50]ASW54838.1 transcriptional regulator [Plantactinospora sp. KBS50]
MAHETDCSTVPRRQLGRYLTQLRTDAGVSLDDAARALRCSRQKIWRIERGMIAVRTPDLSVMCDLYRVVPAMAEVLSGVAREGRARGWWQAYGDAIPAWFSLYVGLEEAASRLRHYNAELVPGLLQTRAFMLELHRVNRPELPAAERDRAIAVRLHRQRLLVRRLPPAPDLEVILSEAVLRRPVPDRAVMRDQLHALRDHGWLPNVHIRILPLSAGPPLAGEAGTFTVLDFPRMRPMSPAEPTTIYCEGLTGALYLDRPAEVAAYTRIWRGLDAAALGEEQSRKLIEAIAEEYGDD